MGKFLYYEHVKESIQKGGDTLLSNEYVSAHSPLTILCSKCDKKYNKSYNKYKSGQRCTYCSGKHKRTLSEVRGIIESKGNKLLSDKYVNCKVELDILCKNCNGSYKICLKNYLQPCHVMCRKCSYERDHDKYRLSYDYVRDYIKKSGNKLISKTYINANTKIEIECNNCCYRYFIRFADYKNGDRCGICRLSKGEREVEKYLLEKNIWFARQKKFPDCKHILSLPFDFYCEYLVEETDKLRFIIPFLIEYNGRQHYQPISIFGGEKYFNARQRNDGIKLRYCEKEDIYLLVIPYTDYKRIEEVIDSYIEFLLKDTSEN
uniref:Restriction endonuclease n=1 Tax=Marseillevirus LCMAC101 TaxID=2506602 RepID=A0A481YSR2_9VIRU|nr:MAG: restriction endonuclease [Marseillevirus LCMAC101]